MKNNKAEIALLEAIYFSPWPLCLQAVPDLMAGETWQFLQLNLSQKEPFGQKVMWSETERKCNHETKQKWFVDSFGREFGALCGHSGVLFSERIHTQAHQNQTQLIDFQWNPHVTCVVSVFEGNSTHWCCTWMWSKELARMTKISAKYSERHSTTVAGWTWVTPPPHTHILQANNRILVES